MKATYVGNCINSFDDSGECLIAKLYSDTSNFAYHEENYVCIDANEFAAKVTLNANLNSEISSNRSYMFDADNVIHIIYDIDTDIHYFFM